MDNDDYKRKPYMNPYLAGIMLGVVLLAAFFLTGRGLGASGAMKSVVVSTVAAVAPEHARESHYFSKYISDGKKPMKSWLVLEVFGVLIGGFISGAVSGRLKFKVERSPKITKKRRIFMALAGGALFGFGSQLGRGCTSGAALSGMAVESLAGYVTMVAIFGSAYIFAYFVRKNWI